MGQNHEPPPDLPVAGLDDGPPSALKGIRVVELGGALTNYCGKLFAEMGADVILVEPPDGSELRHQPPFADGTPDPESSLAFFYQNTSKRSLVADITTLEGQRTVRRLTDSADLVLDASSPGSMQQHGLAPAQLIAGNPRLVVTSITPFGQSGPYAQFAYSDLVCLAFGGMLWMGGYSDGPPVQAVAEQAYMAGNVFGAVSSMIALTHAELTGAGQHVDVSVQEAVAMGLENSAQYFDLEGHIRRRFGGAQRDAGFGVFPCADGHVVVLANGVGGHRFWKNLIEWLSAEHIAGVDRLTGSEWAERQYLASSDAKQLFWDVFTRLSLKRTKEQLYRASQKWRVPLGPVNLPSDVLRNGQLRSREYFVRMNALGRIFDMPGAPYRLSETPWRMSGPAPHLGEHTDAILREFEVDPISDRDAGMRVAT